MRPTRRARGPRRSKVPPHQLPVHSPRCQCHTHGTHLRTSRLKRFQGAARLSYELLTTQPYNGTHSHGVLRVSGGAARHTVIDQHSWVPCWVFMGLRSRGLSRVSWRRTGRSQRVMTLVFPDVREAAVKAEADDADIARRVRRRCTDHTRRSVVSGALRFQALCGFRRSEALCGFKALCGFRRSAVSARSSGPNPDAATEAAGPNQHGSLWQPPLRSALHNCESQACSG